MKGLNLILGCDCGWKSEAHKWASEEDDGCIILPAWCPECREPYKTYYEHEVHSCKEKVKK